MNEDGMKQIAPGIFQKNNTTFYIKCCKSNKLCFCSKERLDILAKKYGGVDKVSQNYVSRDAKRLLKAKTNPDALKRLTNDEVAEEARLIHKEKKEKKEKRKLAREERVQKLEKVPHEEVMAEPLTAEQIAEKSRKHTCLRLKYYLDWGCCNKCMYVEHCEGSLKRQQLLFDGKHTEAVKKLVEKIGVKVIGTVVDRGWEA